MMRYVPLLFSLPSAVFMFGLGLWLVLPRAGRRGRALGAVLLVAALGLLMVRLRLPMVAGWRYETVFWLLGAITVVSGIGTISMRNPVYCALWFAMALLGTGGLLMYVGAQFVGVATVVVYAGAIVVTFLFVLMLAQPRGQAHYDRLSWEPLLSALTGGVMVFLLSLALESSLAKGTSTLATQSPTAEALEKGVLAQEHVATIGGVLFSRYLVAVQVAGVLLLVALVAASAIIAHGTPHAPREGCITLQRDGYYGEAEP
jgi:NADH-quinone oxidoreductase subunit J